MDESLFLLLAGLAIGGLAAGWLHLRRRAGASRKIEAARQEAIDAAAALAEREAVERGVLERELAAQAEAERSAAAAELERQAKAQAEAERLAAAQADAARAAAAQAEGKRLAAAKAEIERAAAAERERAEWVRAEAERVAAAEIERAATARAAAERAASAQAEKAAAAQRERAALARAEAERVAAAEAERIAALQAEAARVAAAQVEARRAAEAHAERERVAALALAAEQAALAEVERQAVAEAVRQRVAADVAAPPTPSAPKSANQTLVLVADDSKVVRIKTGRLLAQHQYQVSYANDGLDAVQQLQVGPPDVVITDVEMPGMDGFELTRQIRGNPKTAHVPVIMITAADVRHREQAEQAGVSVLLGKPYPEDALIAHIRLALGQGEPPAPAVGNNISHTAVSALA
jgi:CheY-like chemotaxis protein